MVSLSYVQTTAYETTSPQFRLPPVIWSAFIYLNKAHGFWRYYREIQLYSKPESLAQMLAGKGLSYLIGDAYIVRMAAQCVLVATRILDCAQQQKELWLASHHCLLAFQGYYPKSNHIAWIKNNSYALSPISVYWWKTKLTQIIDRIERIALQTLYLFKQIFLLSMRIMDVMDALEWGPTSQKEALDESVTNIAKCLNALVSNQEELMDGLTQNRELIQKLLRGTALTYEQLQENVKRACEGANTIYKPLKKASEQSGQALVDFGKKALTGSLSVLGAN